MARSTRRGPPPMPAALAALVRAALGTALLAGCQTYDDTADRDVTARAASAPCDKAGGGQFPAPPAPVNDVEFGTSPKARRARQNGCAGVRMHIGRDGTARDATVLIEEPPGYGFGTATLEGLAQTQYDPKAVKPVWYYYVAVYLPQKPKPQRPPIQ